MEKLYSESYLIGYHQGITFGKCHKSLLLNNVKNWNEYKKGLKNGIAIYNKKYIVNQSNCITLKIK